MSTFPSERPSRRDRLRHRRQQPRLPPHPARLDGRRPDRQGPAAEPRRLDRPRLELHLPGRPLEGDDAAHARVAAPVHRDGRLHRVRRHRGRAHRGADGGAAPADGVREVVGRRLGAARHAGRDQGARAVHRRVDPARRLLLPDRLRRRLPARRHDHARAGRSTPAALQVFANTDVQRDGRRARPDPARAHLARDDRGRDGRDRLRRLEPAARGDGRRAHPAHAGRPPDDRRRPGAALREALDERDRVPDRARHGRVHVRAPGRRRPRDRLLRAPLDPPRPRGDPVDRGGGALADGVPVHAGGLRPTDGARARPDARDRRRRVGRREVRDQRPHLADARRDADPRRDARGEGPLVGGGGVGEGRARRRQVGGRVDGARRVAHRPAHAPT